MSVIEDLATLSLDQIEEIKKLTMRWIFQAAMDFGFQSHDIFLQSPDEVKDVAEDIARELLDRLPGFNVPERVYGTVDYKRARYVVLPEKIVRQAVFIDSKAEKTGASARLQMSQMSLCVRQPARRVAIEEQGKLPTVYLTHSNQQYLTTTAFLHFMYSDDEKRRHHLKRLMIFCLPNGKLQQRYNPDANTGIWQTGAHSPRRGEKFRARVSFHKLKRAAKWRVQKIEFDAKSRACQGPWSE